MSTRMFVASNHRVWISMSQCAWCRGVRLWRWYLRLPRMPLLLWMWTVSLPHPLPSLTIGTTHGACPRCAERVNRAVLARHFSPPGEPVVKVAA